MHSRGDPDRLGMALTCQVLKVYRLQLGLSWLPDSDKVAWKTEEETSPRIAWIVQLVA